MLKLFVALQTRVMNLRDEKGQAYAEYGILLALVAVGLIAALGLFAKDIADAFKAIGGKVLDP